MFVMIALVSGAVVLTPFKGPDAQAQCNFAKPVESFCLKVEPEGFNLNTGRLSYYVKPE